MEMFDRTRRRGESKAPIKIYKLQIKNTHRNADRALWAGKEKQRLGIPLDGRNLHKL